MNGRFLLPALIALIVSAGCDGMQSALDPRGPQAARIAHMWWIIFAVSAVILTTVTALGLNAARRTAEGKPRLSERQGRWLVALGGCGIPVAVLLMFLVYSVRVGNANASLPAGDAVVIEAVARQWWWDFHYRDEDDPSLGARTSNEIYIPVGRPVQFNLRSLDVIHSFWIPSLHGKTDMIPGRINTTWVQADEEGVFRGQCAEFCGMQHSLMAFEVVAVPENRFEAWLELQRSPAREPEEPSSRRGREVFLASSCGLCHMIRGTIALGHVAPDLTHFGGRRKLAAATMPNTRGHLGGWIVHPDGTKPGSHMPPNQVEPADLTALLDYLQSLR